VDGRDFEIGKAQILNEGSDVTIIACGIMVWKALEAGIELEKKGISADIINMHTVKPLDEAAVLASVEKTGCVVTAEEHQKNGGLGGSIAQLLSCKKPTPIEMVAVNDSFGESGTPGLLMAKYGIDTPDILKAVERVLERK